MATANFRKVRPGAGAYYYAAEAAGLRWLTVEGGPQVPTVFAVQDAALELERIADEPPCVAAAHRFGGELATLHSSGASAFGVGPPGAPVTGWIADLPLPYGEFTDFGSMYAQLRIRPYVKLCRESELLSHSDLAVFELLCTRLLEGDPALTGPPESPARLHGDLWSGNLVWSTDRLGTPAIWLIDPAAYGGHRESDLAMLALFGTPLLDQIIGAYESVTPLAPGWRQRVALHQVYPLLVHTIMFGGGYAGRALQAAQRALDAS